METKNGKIPLWFATAEGNLIVVSYLIKQDHDAYSLVSDRKVFQTLKNICSLPIFDCKTFVSTVCLQFDGLRKEIEFRIIPISTVMSRDIPTIVTRHNTF